MRSKWVSAFERQSAGVHGVLKEVVFEIVEVRCMGRHFGRRLIRELFDIGLCWIEVEWLLDEDVAPVLMDRVPYGRLGRLVSKLVGRGRVVRPTTCNRKEKH